MNFRADDITFIGNKVPVTRLGFGAATQGGLFEAVAEADAMTVFQSAWDAGIRYFDTAPWYGFGLSEQRLGAFLQGKSGFSLSSKTGRLLSSDYPVHPSQADASFVTPSTLNVKYDYSYEATMRSLEESLGRLKISRIDIALIHDPDSVGLNCQEIVSGAAKALFELRDQGVIGAVGAGMNQWELPLELAQAAPFDVFLLAGRYTLLEQDSLPFMQYCANNNIKIIVGGVYNSGLLANPTPNSHYNYEPVPATILARALALQKVCLAHGVPLRAAALQFPLRQNAVASVLIAARSTMQLEDNITMFHTSIPNELWAELHATGLLKEEL
jgi:D-threo-aldose 1-dehydrogenase